MKAYTIRNNHLYEGIQLEGLKPYLFLGQFPSTAGFRRDAYVKVLVKEQDASALVRGSEREIPFLKNPLYLFDAEVIQASEKPEIDAADYMFVKPTGPSEAILIHLLVDEIGGRIVWNKEVEILGCFINEHQHHRSLYASFFPPMSGFLAKFNPKGRILVPVYPLERPAYELKIAFNGRKITIRRSKNFKP